MSNTYDCAIIGGGLAGLCLSIQLAEHGISVVLFEKNQYPFHKVCGEYISMESWDFLARLGMPLNELDLPIINELGISSEKGFMLNHQLGLGGFGISRFTLDSQLAKIAADKGVEIVQNCKVYNVSGSGVGNRRIETTRGLFESKIICGSYGKYTPAFINSDPDFNKTKQSESTKFIGVKYYINTNLAANRIELHNFQDGYCGISKVGTGAYCLCYLTTAKNLRENGNDIKQMEGQILYKNPLLKQYFTESEFVNSQAMVISNIQFQKKQTLVNEIFLLGDSAGSITPLCGNGMSMGMRASKLLADLLIPYFDEKITLGAAATNYQKAWDYAFEKRIKSGYYLQNLFGKKNTTDIALRALSKFPLLMNKLVSLTHGEKF
ncbi:NAD(P)/FAD-dependent oxidoreductase [Dyadobacter sp. CY345]|uniref:NAD(P)/FAD-dependent oxidoreductase n=1 Tax=Dyadobacter sp. CY345 TaxID=2909335 RepID=UPI001F330150|nr:NAD(P)/FAD-dependent oxidoreductase [Dyadobacter sp. CY345]MCF2443806.1 NAD(P)/FAD-dependent oxidoreductase [Dyadobacter sp. CY345]